MASQADQTNYGVREVLCDYGHEDYDLMRRILETRDEMTEEEAAEWLDYNTLRALPYAGENAPVVMYRIENPEADKLFGVTP